MSAYLLVAPTPSPSPVSDVSGGALLNTPTLAGLLGTAITALIAVFYAILRGKLRPESAVRDAREDRDARIAEAREDRDARLQEARAQIEMWQQAHAVSEEARRSQEALLRESTMEIGKTVQHVLDAFDQARRWAHDADDPA